VEGEAALKEGDWGGDKEGWGGETELDSEDWADGESMDTIDEGV
jgi:hypothetical protein